MQCNVVSSSPLDSPWLGAAGWWHGDTVVMSPCPWHWPAPPPAPSHDIGIVPVPGHPHHYAGPGAALDTADLHPPLHTDDLWLVPGSRFRPGIRWSRSAAIRWRGAARDPWQLMSRVSQVYRGRSHLITVDIITPSTLGPSTAPEPGNMQTCLRY